MAQLLEGVIDQRVVVTLQVVGNVNEAERVEWVPRPEVRALIQRGEMMDGLSLAAVLWVLTFDR